MDGGSARWVTSPPTRGPPLRLRPPTKPLSPEEEAAFRSASTLRIPAALNDEAEGLRGQGLIDDMFSFLDGSRGRGEEDDE